MSIYQIIPLYQPAVAVAASTSLVRLPRRPATSQPQQLPQIDWSNPLARGLVYAWAPANDTLNKVSGPTLAATPQGVALSTDGFSYEYANSAPQFSLDECSVTALLTPAFTGTATTFAVGVGNSTDSNPLFLLGQGGAANQVAFRTRDTPGTDVEVSGASAKWADGVTCVVTGVRSKTGGAQKVYAGGAQVATAAVGTASATTFDRLCIGGLLRSSFGLGWFGKTGLVLIHNRALSAAEHKSLSDNPWQLFKTQQRTLMLTSGSGGGVSYSASLSDSLTLADVSTAGVAYSVSMSDFLTLVEATTTAAGITYVGTGAFQSSATALTVPVPAGYQAGDLLITVCETANEAIVISSATGTVTNMTPSSTGTAAAAGGVRLTIGYRIATASEASFTTTDSGDHQTAQMFCFRGVDPTTPILTSASSVQASAATAWTLPAVSPTVSGAAIVLCVANDRDLASTTNLSAWTNSNLASVTEIADQTVATGAGGGIGVAWGIFGSTGSTGTTAVTSAASNTGAFTTLALNPLVPNNYFGVSGDIITVTDAAGAALGMASAGADSVTLADAAAAVAAFAAAGAETLTLTDSATSVAAFAGSQSDTVVATDAGDGTVGSSTLVQADSVTVSDTRSGIAAFLSATTDTLSATDASSNTAAFSAASTDTATPTDAATATAAFNAAATDSTPATDSASVLAAGTLVSSDTLVITDSTSATAALSALRADVLAATDLATAMAAANVSQSDTVALSDLYASILAAACSMAEVLALTESRGASLVTSAVIGDTLIITDTRNWAGGIIYVSPERTAIFDGSGTNKVVFEGGANRVVFEGGINRVVFVGAGSNKAVFEGGLVPSKVIF